MREESEQHKQSRGMLLARALLEHHLEEAVRLQVWRRALREADVVPEGTGRRGERDDAQLVAVAEGRVP